MHKARNIAAMLGLDRHNKTPVSLGDNGFLQIFRPLPRNQAVERFAHLARNAPQFAADGQQFGRGAVRDLLLGHNRGCNRFFQRAVAGQQTENRRQRGLFLLLRVVHERAARGLQQACHIQQFARIQCAATVGALQNRTHCANAAKRRAAVPDHAVFRVRGLIHPDLRLLMVVERAQRAAFLLRRIRCSLRGQPLENFIIFQCF